MPEKIYIIVGCNECKYNYWGKCFHPDVVKKGRGRLLLNVIDIPSWCPLPDKEGK